MSEARARLRADIRDRAALARRWLGVVLNQSVPRITGSVQEPKADLEKPMCRMLVKLFVDATRGTALPELGGYVQALEEGRMLSAAPCSWLTPAAVRAVYLMGELRARGIDV